MESDESAVPLGASRRIRVVESSAGLRVLIGPGRRLADGVWGIFVLLILAVVMTSWVSMAPEMLAAPTPAVAFFGFVSLALMFFAVVGVVNMMWKFFGREELDVSGDTLTMSARLFFFTRRRSFALSTIRNVRLQCGPAGASDSLGRGKDWGW